MSQNEESATLLEPNRPAVLPENPQTLFRPDEVLLADALSNAADLIKWPRMSELRGFEQMAGLVTAAGHYPWKSLQTFPRRSELTYTRPCRMDSTAAEKVRRQIPTDGSGAEKSSSVKGSRYSRSY